MFCKYRFHLPHGHSFIAPSYMAEEL